MSLWAVWGWPDATRRSPHRIGGGQAARRVAIARALVSEPSFLIADEPTAGLDVSVQGELLNLLSDLQKSLSLGILMVSHNLNVIGRVTDRVAVMYLGKVVEEGPTHAVFRNPRHPYTHALLSANPVIDPEHRRTKLVLAGEIPSPSNPPSGCRFHTRCPRVQDRCRVEEPALTPAPGRRPLRLPLPIGERGIDRIGIRTERPVFMKRRGDGAHGGVNGRRPPPERWRLSQIDRLRRRHQFESDQSEPQASHLRAFGDC